MVNGKTMSIRKRLVKVFLPALLSFCFIADAAGQNTLYFQGFENTSCDNWSFTGGNVNSETARAGTRSVRVGRSGENNTVTFNSVNVAGYSDLKLSLYHAVRSGSGPGMDTREGAAILISLNGGAFTAIGRVGGFGDANWSFAAATGGAGSASSGCTVYQTSNPLLYDIPPGTASVQLRAVSVGLNASSCGNYNNA